MFLCCAAQSESSAKFKVDERAQLVLLDLKLDLKNTKERAGKNQLKFSEKKRGPKKEENFRNFQIISLCGNSGIINFEQKKNKKQTDIDLMETNNFGGEEEAKGMVRALRVRKGI